MKRWRRPRVLQKAAGQREQRFESCVPQHLAELGSAHIEYVLPQSIDAVYRRGAVGIDRCAQPRTRSRVEHSGRAQQRRWLLCMQGRSGSQVLRKRSAFCGLPKQGGRVDGGRRRIEYQQPPRQRSHLPRTLPPLRVREFTRNLGRQLCPWLGPSGLGPSGGRTLTLAACRKLRGRP